MPVPTGDLYYTGSGGTSSDSGTVATTSYVANTLNDILDPLQPLEPLEASVGFHYIVGQDAAGNRKEIALIDKPYVDKLAYVTLAGAKCYANNSLQGLYTTVARDFNARIANYVSFVEEVIRRDFAKEDASIRSWVANDFMVPSINRVSGWQQDILNFVRPYFPKGGVVEGATKCYVNTSLQNQLRLSIEDTDARVHLLDQTISLKINHDISVATKGTRDWVAKEFQIPSINRINNWQTDILDFIRPYFPKGGDFYGASKCYVNEVLQNQLRLSLNDTSSRLSMIDDKMTGETASKIGAAQKEMRLWVEKDFMLPSVNRINNWQQDILNFILPHTKTSTQEFIKIEIDDAIYQANEYTDKTVFLWYSRSSTEFDLKLDFSRKQTKEEITNWINIDYRMSTINLIYGWQEDVLNLVTPDMNCALRQVLSFSINDSVERIRAALYAVDDRIESKIDDDIKALRHWTNQDFMLPSINRVRGWQEDILDFVKPYFPKGGGGTITGIEGAVIGDVVGDKIQSRLNVNQRVTNTHLYVNWDAADYGVLEYSANNDFSIGVSSLTGPVYGSFVMKSYFFADNKVVHYQHLSPFLIQDFNERTWDFHGYRALNLKVDTPINDGDIANKQYVDENSGGSVSIHLVGDVMGSGVSGENIQTTFTKSLDQLDVLADIDFKNKRLKNIGAPVNEGDATSKAYVDAKGLIGEIKMWFSSVIPEGFLLCDGRAVAISDYSKLFAVIKDSVGYNETHFFLPQMQGYFPRGFDADGTVDKGTDERIFFNIDGTQSFKNAIGTYQNHSTEWHYHNTRTDATLLYYAGGGVYGSASGKPGSAPMAYDYLTNAQQNGTQEWSETRPKNIAVNFIIRYN